jgi:hypothetical protein
MSDSDLDERLATELGGTAYRLPPPPLAEVHRRATRRHRARVTRRAAGTALAAALAVLAANTALTGGGGDASPARPTGRPEPACGGYLRQAPPGDHPRAMLPDRLPARTVLRSVSSVVEVPQCDVSVINAWSADAATGRVERWLRLSAVGSTMPAAGDGCAALRRFASGTCQEATAAGERRWIVRVHRASQEKAVWYDAGRVWWVAAVGYDAAGFDAMLPTLRVDEARGFLTSSVPRGLQVWPSGVSRAARGWPEFSATFLPRDGSQDLNGPDAVRIEVKGDPSAEPFELTDAEPDTTTKVVEVGDRPGLWNGTGKLRVLTWRTADGATLNLYGSRLTLTEALAVGASVRPVAAGDPRLTVGG